MKNEKTLDTFSMVLLILGGICWGLIGTFGFDLIGSVFGTADGTSALTRIIYVLIGLAALYRLFKWLKK